MDTNRIKLPVGGVDLVANLMGVTRRCVFMALSGERKNDLAQRIRRCALNHGGFIAPPSIPHGQWLSVIDRDAGRMICTFWNGFIARVSLQGEPMQIEAPDGRIKTVPDPSRGRLFGILYEINAAKKDGGRLSFDDAAELPLFSPRRDAIEYECERRGLSTYTTERLLDSFIGCVNNYHDDNLPEYDKDV